MSVINTNITSMIGQQNLNKSQNALQTSMERLSSGLRINSAKDDAAGQAIANRMSAQITGLATAQRNANDGISVAQTAEGALNQVNDNLQRIRELAVQAENGTNSQNDLDSIQNEINQRLNEITRISDETSFNDTKVLQSDQGMKIQVGANDGEAITIDLKEINVKTLGMEGFNVTGAGEIDNAAATKDDLTLAGAVQQTDGAGDLTNEYVLSTDNDLASTTDVLDSIATEGSSVAVGDATYTVNAEGNFTKSQTYANGDGAGAIADAMTPANAGETVQANVTIGGEDTDITIASDGTITSTASGNALYLDTTGNLTENGAGSPPAATIDNLSQSLATQSGSTIKFDDGTTFTNGGIAGAGSEITNGDTALTAAALTTNLNALAGTSGTPDPATNYGTLSVSLNGEAATTVYVDDSGNLFTDNDGANTAYEVADTTALASSVASGTASVEIVAAGTGDNTNGDTTNVDETYTANYEVNLSGQEVTTSDISDAMKADSDAGTGNTTYTLTANVEDSDGALLGNQAITFEFADDGSLVDEGIDFAALGGGLTAANQLGAAGEEVRLSAGGGNLTSEEFSNVSYFAQENGNVTNDSGQRIYKDAEGDFTTEATTEAERSSLSDVDSALSMVDSLRSDLGAIQNRMESAIENLSTTETNLSAARSRIEDADYAVEVANMTRAQILQQAGTSVLAQANQIPQNVLSLLG